MFVVGEKDREAGTVSVRDRLEGELPQMPLDAAIDRLRKEIDAKTVRQVAKRQPPAVRLATVTARTNTNKGREIGIRQLTNCCRAAKIS
jgi:hypothetical protein